ncbi:MAG: hypothetical protein GX419_05095 [Bacteroidales bacterium]|nr:hypothetical protein [Bacteroidales bacterium]
MKRILPLFIILFFLGCSKDSVMYRMTAFINGDAWQCIMPVIVVENMKLVITGTSLDGRTIIITVNGISPGRYQLSAAEGLAQCAALYKASLQVSDEDAYASIDGSITLSSVDQVNNRVSGTFQFSCYRNLTESVSITQGQITNAKITF